MRSNARVDGDLSAHFVPGQPSQPGTRSQAAASPCATQYQHLEPRADVPPPTMSSASPGLCCGSKHCGPGCCTEEQCTPAQKALEFIMSH